MPRKNNTANKAALVPLTLVARIRTLLKVPVDLLDDTVGVLLAGDVKLIWLALAIFHLLAHDELILGLNGG